MAKKKKRKVKRKARPIVMGHLEDISSQIFESYQKELTELIRGNFGVYALYKRNKLYYVGLATNFKRRLKDHLTDRHQKKWDRFSLYTIRKQGHVKEIEALLLHIADPKGNTQTGKLKGSKDILPKLDQMVRERQEDERIKLLGRKKTARAKVSKKKKTASKADKPLKGMFPKGKRLTATYKGKEFKAWVFRSGTVKLKSNGQLYDSPSAAGKVTRGGRSTNGWAFWKYKDKSGNLVKLTNVRKK